MRLQKHSLTGALGPLFEVLIFSNINPNLPPDNLHPLILIMPRTQQRNWQLFRELEAVACAPKESLRFQGGTATSIYLCSSDPDTQPLSSMTKLLSIFRWFMLSLWGFFLFLKFIYLFIFGCIGSSLVRSGFL